MAGELSAFLRPEAPVAAPAAAPAGASGSLSKFLEENRTSGAGSFARGLAQEASFGLADEIAGAAESLFSKKTYKQARDESRDAYKRAEEDNPLAYTGGQVAGGLASMALPLGAAGRAVSTAGKVVRVAAPGAVYGFGKSEADSLGGLAADTAMGGAAAAGLYGLGRGVGYGAKKAYGAVKDSPAVEIVKNALMSKAAGAIGGAAAGALGGGGIMGSLASAAAGAALAKGAGKVFGKRAAMAAAPAAESAAAKWAREAGGLLGPAAPQLAPVVGAAEAGALKSFRPVQPVTRNLGAPPPGPRITEAVPRGDAIAEGPPAAAGKLLDENKPLVGKNLGWYVRKHEPGLPVPEARPQTTGAIKDYEGLLKWSEENKAAQAAAKKATGGKSTQELLDEVTSGRAPTSAELAAKADDIGKTGFIGRPAAPPAVAAPVEAPPVASVRRPPPDLPRDTTGKFQAVKDAPKDVEIRVVRQGKDGFTAEAYDDKGLRIGQLVTHRPASGGHAVADVEVSARARRLGVASKLYEAVNDRSQKAFQVPLGSGKLNEHSTALWESFVKRGMADKTSDGYRMTGGTTDALKALLKKGVKADVVPEADRGAIDALRNIVSSKSRDTGSLIDYPDSPEQAFKRYLQDLPKAAGGTKQGQAKALRALVLGVKKGQDIGPMIYRARAAGLNDTAIMNASFGMKAARKAATAGPRVPKNDADLEGLLQASLR